LGNQASIITFSKPILKVEAKMDHHKNLATEKRIEALKITQAYAEYKTRHAGDLDSDLSNWANNIKRYIENKRQTK